MHIAWTRHLLDNREFIVGGGTQPNTEPSRGEGLDGSATAEERDNYHWDAYENARNHASPLFFWCLRVLSYFPLVMGTRNKVGKHGKK